MKRGIILSHFAVFTFVIFLLMSCDSTEKDWTKAKSTNTISEYQNFLGKHPTGEYSTKAKTAILEIQKTILCKQLENAVDYVIAKFVESSRNFQFSLNVYSSKLSQNEKDRLQSLGNINCDLSMEGVQVNLTSPDNKIAPNGYVQAILSGSINHKIIIGEGNIGINNGEVFIGEGTKITIDTIKYIYTGGRLNESK